jgi:D-serine deaminase-like pyridoxal phosphate-dependent protein
MKKNIEKPTLLLNTERVHHNIQRMFEKAKHQGIRFRPHFKTHQSAIIGDWFRSAGISAITVSSVEMAQYFARNGWDDITIAFPANLRQVAAYNHLAQSIRLGLLVESTETAIFLRDHLTAPAEIWIEIDEGTHRTGIDWDQPEVVLQLLRTLQPTNFLKVRGLLTHAGRIYRAGSPTEIRQIYQEVVQRMNFVRQFLAEQGFTVEISVGNTPGCTLCDDLGLVDEIRPGNFVLYDSQQLVMNVCSLQDIAAVVACPVVAKYPKRGEVITYGGAVHLSKDTVPVNAQNVYGLVVTLTDESESKLHQRWIKLVEGGFVTRLSQEHGVVSLPGATFNLLNIGDLLYVIPAHVCLTVSALGEYLTTDGQIIPTLNK